MKALERQIVNNMPVPTGNIVDRAVDLLVIEGNIKNRFKSSWLEEKDEHGDISQTLERNQENRTFHRQVFLLKFLPRCQEMARFSGENKKKIDTPPLELSPPVVTAGPERPRHHFSGFFFKSDWHLCAHLASGENGKYPTQILTTF